MPFHFDSPLSRKRFLQIGSASLLGLACKPLSLAATSPHPASSEPTHHFALLSDTHIAQDPKDTYRGFFPTRNLQTVIQQVMDSPTDMAFLNGDAARFEGKADDYQQLQKLLKPLTSHCPITIGMGNHDNRDNFRQVFEPTKSPEQDSTGKLVSVVDTPHATWIMLDSLLYVDRVAGLLGKAQRTWLSQFLQANTTKPILLVVHHTLGDNDGDLLDSQQLLDLCRRARNVQAIFYGHSHRYELSRDGDLNLINLPAIGYNFDDQQPVGWCSATLRHDGFGLQLHAIAGNQSQNGQTTDFSWRS